MSLSVCQFALLNAHNNLNSYHLHFATEETEYRALNLPKVKEPGSITQSIFWNTLLYWIQFLNSRLVYHIVLINLPVMIVI